ncbi:MAG: hypothetical protein ABI782_03970 [Anaerolineaceae bacterium]
MATKPIAPGQELEKPMEKQKKLLTLGAGMASMAAVLGGSVFMIGGGSANAASESSGAYTITLAATNQADNADHAAAQAAYIKALAAKLGVSETALTGALKSVQLDQIAQAVTDGKMTQAQADEITARINSGDAPLFGIGGPGHDGGPRGGGPGGPGGPGGLHADGTALATFLGVDQATLETALHSGKSLATVAGENGKSRDDLKTFLTTQLKAGLTKAVTDGKLTQAQADAKLAEETANMDAHIDQVGDEGGPRGGRPDMGRPGAGGPHHNGSVPTNPSSSPKPGA